jgi:iron(III) transport system substrate-binding protein
MRRVESRDLMAASRNLKLLTDNGGVGMTERRYLGLLINIIIAGSFFLLRVAGAVEGKPTWQAEWERTVGAARKEGEVMLYASNDYEILFKEFQKKYADIAVKGFYGRGSDVAQRIMAERRAAKPIADLYIDGMTTGYNVLYKGKVLDPIKPALILPEVADESKWWRGKHHYVDPEGKYLFIFNGQSRVELAYNTKLVNPKEIRSYWDLLNPKWKGKIVALDPTTGGAGTSVRFIYHSPFLGREFLRRLLTETEIIISRDSRQMADWLAGGRVAFAIFSGIDRMDLDKAKEQGLPVGWFVAGDLKEGAAITAGSGGLALINGAPHPNAAKVAINWLLSREGQMAYQKIFAAPDIGPDSLRIDIPKDTVPLASRRVDGEEAKYPQTDKAEWMDFTPIRKFINEVWSKAKK